MTRAPDPAVEARARELLAAEIPGSLAKKAVLTLALDSPIATIDFPVAMRAIIAALTQASGEAMREETYAEWQQKRGMLADTIDWAINEYDEFMKDDHYEPWEILRRIIGRLRERRDMLKDPAALSPAPAAGATRDDALVDDAIEWLKTEHRHASLQGIHNIQRYCEAAINALKSTPSPAPTEAMRTAWEDALENISIREIALSAIKRARAAGESQEMLARWISEDIRVALKTRPQAGNYHLDVVRYLI